MSQGPSEQPPTPPTEVTMGITGQRPRPIAPLWHMALLILLFVAFGAAGFVGAAHKLKYSSQAEHYLVIIAFEWVVFFFVWFGVRRGGNSLRDVIGGQWKSARDFFRDVGIGLGFWVASLIVLAVAQILLRNVRAIPKGFAPGGAFEILLWGVVAASAGICEETIFRGYLQKQIHALTGSLPLAVLLQGVVFGFAHGYQGWKSTVTISVFGMMFGILAAWRKSVRPGMMVHGWQDFFAGIALKYVDKLPHR
jgi:membrane protease YdiL (CAAX protease family)